MRASDWAQLESIFLNAARLPEKDRETYIDEVCGTNTEFRRQAEGLFSPDSEAIRDIGAVIAATVRRPGTRY